MTSQKQISELRLKLGEKQKKINKLNIWLLNHFDSELRGEVIIDVTILSVEIRTLKFKISNLKSKRPLLGYEIPDVDASNETK